MRKFYPYFFTVLAIILSTFIWEYIEFPYDENNIIDKSKTVLWNGPMGVFEIADSSKGTFAIAKAVAEGDGISIIGGGDSVKAINQSGFSDQVTFMSTGGGASLEFLEGKSLPGVSVLDRKENT